MPGSVEWAQDVYACKECGSLWRFQFHPKDMYTESALLIPAGAEPLVRAGTPWDIAWEIRKLSNDLLPQYIHLYFQRTRLHWRDVARTAVGDAISEGASINAISALRGIFTNWPSLHAGNIKPSELEALWAQLERIRPEPVDSASGSWSLLEQEVKEAIRLRESAGEAARKLTLEREERARKPKPGAPYVHVYTERIPGPEVQDPTLADRPGAREVMRGTLQKLGAAPFAYVLPALGTSVVMEGLAPASQASALTGPLLLPMCLMAYAAQASRVSGRWDQSFWKLYIDRFGQIFQIWGALVLTFLFTLGIGFLVLAWVPGEMEYRRELDFLAVALFFIPLSRFWPVVVTTFVYRGHLYYESLDIGSDSHAAWIGPGLKAAWRISGQKGFLRKISLPLLGGIGAIVAVLYGSEFAWWARAFCYLVALPLLVQFADEAIERWRIPTGKPDIDW